MAVPGKVSKQMVRSIAGSSLAQKVPLGLMETDAVEIVGHCLETTIILDVILRGALCAAVSCSAAIAGRNI